MEHNNLRERIVEKYGSIRKFSTILGKKQQSTNLKVQGKVGFSRDEIINWSKLLNISTKEYYSFFIE